MKVQVVIIALFCWVNSISIAQFWDYSNPIKLGGTVNSDAEESIPVFSKDSSVLFFVRTYDPTNVGGENDQDIWYSRKEGNNYGACEKLSSVNNKYNNAIVGLNKSGTSMYLLNSYDGKKDFEKGIALSEGKGTNWSSPKKIDIAGLDVEGDYYSFYVSEDESVIIISHAGPNTLGLEDLYVSIKGDNGWELPKHMGKKINSTGFEISPFLSKNNDTLFYSSNGLGGEGDADIFYSVRQGSWTDWSTPINLGPKINSPKFDAYFIHSGNHAYWSSNREAQNSDIYMVNILTPPALSASCSSINVTEYQGNDGSIELTIDGGVSPIVVKWSNGSSKEDLIFLKKGEYSALITDAIGQTAEVTCSITEPQPVVDKPIRLPEVRYPFDEWTLLVDGTINSLDSLLYVYDLLIEYPGIVLELYSHTDSRGSNIANQNLSINRARACYKYLVEEKGIDPRRIVPIGKGESQPRTVWVKGNQYFAVKPMGISDAEQVVLTEAYINKFSGDEQMFEMLHQLNRRTEGRIITKEFDPTKYPSANPKLLKFVKYP